MQTRFQSVIESLAQTAIGLITGVVAGQLVIYPVFGWHVSLHTNIEATMAFTVVSMVRGYLMRRLFNYLHHR